MTSTELKSQPGYNELKIELVDTEAAEGKISLGRFPLRY